MSSATAYVRFPDGEIRFGIYFGTVDLMEPLLFATQDQAWDYWRSMRGKGDMPEQDGEPGPEVEVEVWCTYGGEQGWKGKATRHKITDGVSPYGEEDQMGQVIIPAAEGRTKEPFPWVKEALRRD